MAKKWKAYPWPERPEPSEEEEEEIDVVGDSPGSCWGPSSPTAGATAPSPPPTSPHGTSLLYNGKHHNYSSHRIIKEKQSKYIFTRSIIITGLLIKQKNSTREVPS